ncbi:MAG: tRNA lysidine(34) synthetase TilS, partial [Betaproteobacteria bacterium]|nr:tRNA lysidine(34) synthetase TilS [Betaproteobacteria bacterium]
MAASRNSRSPDLPARVARRLAELLVAEGPGLPSPLFPQPSPAPSSASLSPTLAVGLSGGRDSVTLLAALVALAPARGWRLCAVHVHHGLSANADAWAQFCADLCQRLAIPLQVHRVSVPLDSGQGLEAAAREARYRIFAGLDADALILGHHRDDQAETLLFNLLRGAGLRGLAAMPARRLLPRPGAMPLPLLRPLLDVPRAEIESWLGSQGLAWIEDESNADTRYARNFLRREVLPLLQSRFPAAASLARTARLAGEAEELLAEVAAQDLAAASLGGSLRASALAQLSAPRGRNLLRHWLRRHGTPMPEAQALEELWQQLLCPRPDGQVEWRCGQWVVRVWRGTVFLEQESPELPSPLVSRPWQGETSVPWPWGSIHCQEVRGAGIGARFLSTGAHFQLRQGGEHLRLPGRPKRLLKKMLQEADIPPWQRERVPLLWIGDTPAWVPGLGIAAQFACPEGEA